MSKHQQFFLVTLLLTLLTGCQSIPQNTTEAIHQPHNQDLCEEQLAPLKQDKKALTAKLALAKKQIQQLKNERQELKAKLDALTAIERSLHQRKQRQSNEL